MAKKPKSLPPAPRSPSDAPALATAEDPSACLLGNVHPSEGESPSVCVPVIVIEPMAGEVERDEIAQALAAEAFGQLAVDSRPDISHLDDALALVDGEKIPLFNVGDKIVVERTYERFGVKTWLDTNVYEVLEIDDLTGKLRLYNHELHQHAMSGFKGTGEDSLLIKLANTSDTGLEHVARRKRGRPRKNPAMTAPKKADLPSAGGEKRGRGRPKGSKNRPKEVIAHEREQKRLERQGKREKKSKR